MSHSDEKKIYYNFQYLPKINYHSKKKDIDIFDQMLNSSDPSFIYNALIPASKNETIKFCIVIPSYNNEKYITQNLNSIFIQNYHNWRIVYVDDNSDDQTLHIASKLKSDGLFSDNKFLILANKPRQMSPVYSFYHAAHNICADEDVMIQFDGDDMLASEDVLYKLAEIYSKKDVWLTFGSHMPTDGIRRIKIEQHDVNITLDDPRNYIWLYSHLRTSYTWLFKKIKQEDLKVNGTFLNYAGDLAVMFPMIEMAGKTKIEPIYEIIHLHRIHNNNVYKDYRYKQIELEQILRKKEHYSLLSYKQFNNSSEDQKQENIFSQIYVINLPQAKNRWEYISKHLTMHGLNFTKWNATNGYEIKILDKSDNSTFLGSDLKQGKKIIAHKNFYKVYCNSIEVHPISFTFRGYLNWKKNTISAGELGLWCSNYLIWLDSIARGYKRILVLEDDAVLLDGFNKNITNFIENIPNNFDLAFPYYGTLSRANFIKINDHAYSLNNTLGWGNVGVIYNIEAIKKLLNIPFYSAAIDEFYNYLSSGKYYNSDLINSDLKKFAGTFNNYVPSTNLVVYEDFKDDLSLDNMGRYKTGLKNTTLVIDQIYLVNLEHAKERYEFVSQQFIKHNISFIRWNATYGYDIKIVDRKNNFSFTGNELKTGEKKLLESNYYDIYCDPQNPNSSFIFMGYLNWKKTTISAGELGIWCSSYLIWLDAKEKSYKNILVFEDDIELIDGFRDKIAKFLANTPNSLDIGFLHYSTPNNKTLLKYNEYAYSLRNNYGWDNQATIYSAKAINKLLSLPHFSGAIDNFFCYLSSGNFPLPKSDLDRFKSTFENFASINNLVNLRFFDEISSISNMGRPFGKAYEIKIPGINKIYIPLNSSNNILWDNIYSSFLNASILVSKFAGIDEQDIEITRIPSESDFYINNSGDLKINSPEYDLYNVSCVYENSREEFVYKHQFTDINRSPSAHELSKWCNHKKIWREAIENDYQQFMVINNNIFPKANSKENLLKFINKLPKDQHIAFPSLSSHDAIIYNVSILPQLLAKDHYSGGLKDFLICNNDAKQNQECDELAGRYAVYYNNQALFDINEF